MSTNENYNVEAETIKDRIKHKVTSMLLSKNASFYTFEHDDRRDMSSHIKCVHVSWPKSGNLSKVETTIDMVVTLNSELAREMSERGVYMYRYVSSYVIQTEHAHLSIASIHVKSYSYTDPRDAKATETSEYDFYTDDVVLSGKEIDGLISNIMEDAVKTYFWMAEQFLAEPVYTGRLGDNKTEDIHKKEVEWMDENRKVAEDPDSWENKLFSSKCSRSQYEEAKKNESATEAEKWVNVKTYDGPRTYSSMPPDAICEELLRLTKYQAVDVNNPVVSTDTREDKMERVHRLLLAKSVSGIPYSKGGKYLMYGLIRYDEAEGILSEMHQDGRLDTETYGKALAALSEQEAGDKSWATLIKEQQLN